MPGRCAAFRTCSGVWSESMRSSSGRSANRTPGHAHAALARQHPADTRRAGRRPARRGRGHALSARGRARACAPAAATSRAAARRPRWSDARSSTPREVAAGPRLGRRGDRLGRALRHQPPAAVAALGPEVHDPVAVPDHVEVVLDHDHRVAARDQVVEHLEQPLHVGEVEADGGLVEQVERRPAAALGQLARDLEALRLAARELGRGLAEPQVAEPDAPQHVERAREARLAREVLERLVDGQVERLADVDAAVAHLEHLAPEAIAAAHLARHQQVGEEVHLDRHPARALAVLAAPARRC